MTASPPPHVFVPSAVLPVDVKRLVPSDTIPPQMPPRFADVDQEVTFLGSAVEMPTTQPW